MENPARTGTDLVREQPTKKSNRAWWLAALLLGGVVGSIGCNPAALSYFLFVHDTNLPPSKVAFNTEKKNPKVVILASHASADTMTSDLFNADQLLAQGLAHALTKRYKDHRDQVQIISPLKVQEFKAKNPNWKVMSLEEIGKHFEADYLVSLEINRLSLYEEGSHQQLYRGKTEIHVVVVDVNKTEEGNLVNDTYTCLYPSRGPEVNDPSPMVFRSRFLAKVSRDLSCWFAHFPSEENHRLD